MTTVDDGLDPVTYEILRHRLHQVSRDMAATLERVGGTVNTTQMKDYIAGVYDADGRILSSGEPVIPFHVPCAGKAVQQVLQRFTERGWGIDPGDMFLVNDPYTAAIHQSDVYVVSPVHVGEQLVAWSATFVHVMDIGAHSPGGNSPSAREIFHEGIRVAGLKIVQGGEVRHDIFDTLVNMTRQPRMVALDLRCQIAANNVARQSIIDVCREYDPNIISLIAEHSIKATRNVLRSRLLTIPDGTFRESAAIEAGDRWDVQLALTKRGDSLVFDFDGSSAQADIGVNLPIHATVGSCFEAIVRGIGFDVPGNHGVLDLFSVVAPAGTVVNPTFPAPVSLNTSAGASVVRFLAKTCFSYMLAGSDSWGKEAMAHDVGGRFARHAGINQHGDYYASTLTSIDGNGARATGDGNDSGGPLTCHNVEFVERNFPLLQLFRRHITDGGGAGRYRGGAGEETAWVLHGAPERTIDVVALGVAGFGNSGQGIFGGLPGLPSVLAVARNSRCENGLEVDLRLDEASTLSGEWEPLGYAQVKLGADDVLYLRGLSGGGYGDPRKREPDAVLADLRDGLISEDVAREIYALDPEGRTRPASSSAQAVHWGDRSDRHAGRKGTERFERPLQYGVHVYEDDGGVEVVCADCGVTLADNRDDWLSGCDRQFVNYSISENVRVGGRSSYRFIVRSCPQCGRTFDTRRAPINE